MNNVYREQIQHPSLVFCLKLLKPAYHPAGRGAASSIPQIPTALGILKSFYFNDVLFLRDTTIQYPEFKVQGYFRLFSIFFSSFFITDSSNFQISTSSNLSGNEVIL